MNKTEILERERQEEGVYMVLLGPCASEMEEAKRHTETLKYPKRVTEPVTPSVKGV